MSCDTFYSGMGGTVNSAGEDIDVLRWNAEASVNTEETTHTGSAGYQNHKPLAKGLTGSFEAVMDSEQNVFENPPNLNVGECVALKLYWAEGAKYINIPSAIITGVPMTNEANGLLTYTCNFTANGEYTMDN
jgi:hypothetical protein